MTRLLRNFGSFTAAAATACMLLTTIPARSVQGKTIELSNKRLEGTHALSEADVVELGITDGSGKFILVTEFFWGGVQLVDVEEETFEYIVPSSETFGEKGGLGVTYTHQHILVASAGPLLELPFEIYVYNPAGELVTTCTPPSNVEPGFFNDFEIVGDVAYVTDSTEPRLWKFDIPEAIAGNCNLQSQALSAVFDPAVQGTSIESNGIVSVGNGFFIALFNTGAMYYFEPETELTVEVIEKGTFGRPDGLELVTENDGTLTLYVTVGESNNVFVYKVDQSSDVPSVTFVDTIESSGYDTPATSAVVGNKIYTANLSGDRLPLLQVGEDDLETFTEIFAVVEKSRVVGNMEKPKRNKGKSAKKAKATKRR